MEMEDTCGRLGDGRRLSAVEYRPIRRRDMGRPKQRWKDEHFLKVIRPRCVFSVIGSTNIHSKDNNLLNTKSVTCFG